MLSHRLGNDTRDSLVESIREDIIITWIFHISSKCFCCSDLHLIGDRFFPVFEYSGENPWEGQDIIHLVRIVRSTRTDDAHSCLFRDFWRDLGSRVRHREYDRVFPHSTCHICSEGTCRRYSEEYICSDDSISESTIDIGLIRKFEEFLFRDIESRAVS